MEKEKQAEEKKITLGFLVGWVVGVMFLLSGIMALVSEPLTAVYSFLISIVLLPPANKFIKDKAGFSLSGGLKFVLVIILLGLLSGTLAEKGKSAMNNVDGATKQGETSQSAPIPQKEIVNISAYKLYGDYEANEVSADAKYKDKTLNISGTIDSIGKDIMSNPFVALKGQEYFGFVQCLFSRGDEQKLVNLSKGQGITLRGDSPSRIIGNVLVQNCSIVK